MDCSCYLRKGIVYLPTEGQIVNAHLRQIEPIAVVPLADVDGVRRALRDTIARGNPILPSAPLGDGRASADGLPKYAGVKSWAAFESGASVWDVEEKDGVFRISGNRHRPRGGWVPDPDNVETLPPGSTVDDVIARMIEILQAHGGGAPAGKAPSTEGMDGTKDKPLDAGRPDPVGPAILGSEVPMRRADPVKVRRGGVRSTLCACWLRQRIVYVPVLGIAVDGRYRHTGEVALVPFADLPGCAGC